MLTSARGCEIPTKVLKVVPEEEPEDDEDFEELNEEEDDDNVELSEEELNQVPKAKTVRKFTVFIYFTFNLTFFELSLKYIF